MIFNATEGFMFSLLFGSFQSLDFTTNFQITEKENNYKIYHQQKEKISQAQRLHLAISSQNQSPSSTFHPSLIQHVQDNRYHHQQRDFTNDRQQISS
jgi:hypothetical protein